MITKTLIENFRETVKPVVSQLLFGVNYEGMGTLDCEEFERDFDEILDLALAGYEQKVNNAVSTLDGNKNDMVYRQAAIDALAEQMPTPYTPDGSHPADEQIFQAQEVYADCITTIKLLPPAQPEPAIPLSWVEKYIERLRSLDNEFANLAAAHISVMVKKWRDEQNEVD